MWKRLRYVAAALFVAAMTAGASVPAMADTLEGQLTVTYSDSAGTLTATYTGESSLKNPVYTWYKDGSAVSTSREYKPKDPGRYTCELSDDTYYTNTLTSTSRIDLYSVSGNNITLKNSSGLFEQGKTVSVSAKLSSNEKVVNWKVNVDGVRMPSSGNTVTFTMPSANVTITAEIKAYYTVKVVGGTADKYTASPGDIVTVTASEVDGKKFSTWTTTGGSIHDANSTTATITMPSKNIQITGSFSEYTAEEIAKQKEEEAKANQPAKPTFSDPTHLLYTVPWSNNYKITMEHHSQGPYCDLAFKLAVGTDKLILDYFNIVINDNMEIRETPTPVTICLTLPADLQWGGRNWRVLCVSRGGLVYSFEDEDDDDTTVTFSPDRFFAFALAYNDDPEPEIEEPTEEDIEEVEEDQDITIEYDPSLAPIDEDEDFKTSSAPSASHAVTDSQTADAADMINSTRRAAASSYSSALNVESDKQSAIRTANGARIATLPL